MRKLKRVATRAKLWTTDTKGTEIFILNIEIDLGFDINGEPLVIHYQDRETFS